MVKITDDLIFRVREVLEDYARKEKLIEYNQIEKQIGQEILYIQWHEILDPIYEECMALGDPDLTIIVISKETKRPPYFSQGAKARSVRFDQKKHDAAWSKEVASVFKTWKGRPKAK